MLEFSRARWYTEPTLKVYFEGLRDKLLALKFVILNPAFVALGEEGNAGIEVL
jgi:hypothetical protein